MDIKIGERMDGWMDRWTQRGVDEWVDGWVKSPMKLKEL